MDAYLEAAGPLFPANCRQPLFPALDRSRALSERLFNGTKVWEMVQRRARAAELKTEISCHTFRATGITAYLENGGTIERA